MSKPLEDMIKRFSNAMPEPLRHMQEDMEKNLRGMVETGLQKMNLVTREEFDIQTAVLQRTREKLEALEKRLAELEQAHQPTPLSDAKE
ncbi:MAG: accessory factor UbiK family protein [Thiolinea sp.]